MVEFHFEDSEKEFVCRHCGKFLDSEDLVEGCCPVCETDDGVFLNDNNEN